MLTTRLCAICYQPIVPEERLETIPETRLCIEHAREIHEYGDEFIVIGIEISLGKSNSLKKNYGDICVYKKRNLKALAKLREVYEERSRRKKRTKG